ncbi:hypothetical protein NOCARDAX2BIS_90016 [Nocardioides sp. AX2bis]|nr:hypothetical protein NOCARDAX2BIS_90016 [Nocardioides sp. AX2bis]
MKTVTLGESPIHHRGGPHRVHPPLHHLRAPSARLPQPARRHHDHRPRRRGLLPLLVRRRAVLRDRARRPGHAPHRGLTHLRLPSGQQPGAEAQRRPGDPSYDGPGHPGRPRHRGPAERGHLVADPQRTAVPHLGVDTQEAARLAGDRAADPAVLRDPVGLGVPGHDAADRRHRDRRPGVPEREVVVHPRPLGVRLLPAGADRLEERGRSEAPDVGVDPRRRERGQAGGGQQVQPGHVGEGARRCAPDREPCQRARVEERRVGQRLVGVEAELAPDRRRRPQPAPVGAPVGERWERLEAARSAEDLGERVVDPGVGAADLGTVGQRHDDRPGTAWPDVRRWLVGEAGAAGEQGRQPPGRRHPPVLEVAHRPQPVAHDTARSEPDLVDGPAAHRLHRVAPQTDHPGRSRRVHGLSLPGPGASCVVTATRRQSLAR